MTRRTERGFAAVELVSGVALLVLPVALVVAGLPQWSDRQDVARGAARDAARVVGLLGWCDQEIAAQAVARAAAHAGLETTALRLHLDCTPASLLPRDGEVTARVAVAMPTLGVPMVGSVLGWSWTAQHREPVDPYGSRP